MVVLRVSLHKLLYTMTRRLYVGNLPWSIDTDQLKEMFQEVGEVTFAQVKYKPDGKSRGFGFVEMSTVEEAEAAIKKFDATDFQGRQITVNEAQPRPQNTDGERRPYQGGGDRGQYDNRDRSYGNDDRAPRHEPAQYAEPSVMEVPQAVEEVQSDDDMEAAA